MALISIIIPAFNAAAHIGNALDSVLGQTNCDVEIIVVDGKSSDSTCEIVWSFQMLTNNIVLLSEPDSGIYDAMNKGVSLAKGQWVFFLGADDSLMDSVVLSNIEEVLVNVNPDMLYGNVIFQPQKIVYDGEFHFPKLLKRNICHQSIFYKRSIFSEIGIYSTEFKAHADWDLNLRVFQHHGLNVHYVDNVIANFATGSTSSVHDSLFLRKILIPLWIKNLHLSNLQPNLLTNFDDWWRIIRNSEIPWQHEEYCIDVEVPAFVRSMVKLQGRYSQEKIKIGYFSKLIMFMSYLKFRMAR